MQLVAVVFTTYNSVKNEFTVNDEKAYFYLDMFNLSAGDYALVHNGQHFGVVRVYKTIPTTNERALSKVTKPLLAPVSIEDALIKKAAANLASFRDQTKAARIEKNIREALGEDSNDVLQIETAPDIHTHIEENLNEH